MLKGERSGLWTRIATATILRTEEYLRCPFCHYLSCSRSNGHSTLGFVGLFPDEQLQIRSPAAHKGGRKMKSTNRTGGTLTIGWYKGTDPVRGNYIKGWTYSHPDQTCDHDCGEDTGYLALFRGEFDPFWSNPT